MNKIILVIVLCLVGLVSFGQQKSIISVEKPKTVNLNLPQQKVVSNLRKAGGSLLGGALLVGFGTVLKSNSVANQTIATVIQVGGIVSLAYSGVCLTSAADAYEKSLVVKKNN